MRIKNFSITAKGRPISGELHLPSPLKRPLFGKYPVVIFSHGFYGTRWGTRGDMFMPIVASLLKRGIACIIFDYAGCGSSKYPYWKTSIGTEAEELDAVVAWSRLQKNLNKYKTGIVTHSLGGPVALTRGPEGISCIVVIASPNDPYTRLAARVKRNGAFNPKGISSYGSLSVPGEKREIGPRFWKDAKAYDFRKSVSLFHCPMLVIHGTKDESVPLEDSKKLFSAANSPKQMCMMEGAAHNFKQARHSRQLASAVSNWFSRYFLQRYTEVVDVFVVNNGRILTVKRGSKVGYYKNTWATVAGHVDPGNSPLAQAYAELHEETGLKKQDVKVVAVKKPFYAPDIKLGKIWKINIVLVEAKNAKIKLDWENTGYAWVSPEEFTRRVEIPGMGFALRYALKGTPLGKR